MAAVVEIIQAVATYPAGWNSPVREVLRTPVAVFSEDVIPRWVSQFRTRIGEIESGGMARTAIVHALRMLQLLRREGARPTRVDPVDGECITFLFVKGRVQAGIDCYDNGEIVIGYTDPASSQGPVMWESDGFDTERFRVAIKQIRDHFA